MALLKFNHCFGMVSEFYTKSTAILLLMILLLGICHAGPYLEEGSDDNADETEDYDSSMDRFLEPLQDKRSPSPAVGQIYMPMRELDPIGNNIRRSCIRRGGNCDNRQEDCCYNSTCRCNLWGSNCKCQRLSLFQKWGK